MGLAHDVQSEVLQRLGKVGIAARHAVESLLSGQHRSIHRGLSVEFAGHRAYLPGDDVRHIDWKVYAKTDRHQVRLYEEETRLRATLVVDYSGSMAYRSGEGRSKLDYARMLAGALAFLMVGQGDSVGLATCDSAVRQLLPPGSTMGHVITLLERLEQDQPGGETSLATVLDDLAGRLKRRGLVVLITDAFDDAKRLGLALQHLRYRKQDVRVFQIMDPAEEAFPFQGTYEFLGMEHEPALRLDADRVRRAYQEALADHRRQLAAQCHAGSVIFEHARTDEDLAMVLVRALTRIAQPQAGARR